MRAAIDFARERDAHAIEGHPMSARSTGPEIGFSGYPSPPAAPAIRYGINGHLWAVTLNVVTATLRHNKGGLTGKRRELLLQAHQGGLPFPENRPMTRLALLIFVRQSREAIPGRQ